MPRGKKISDEIRRQVFVFVETKGLSYRKAGEELGIPHSSVSRIHKQGIADIGDVPPAKERLP